LKVDRLEASTVGGNITIVGNITFGSDQVYFNRVGSTSGNSIAVNAGETWKTDYLSGTTAASITVNSNLSIPSPYALQTNSIVPQTGALGIVGTLTTTGSGTFDTGVYSNSVSPRTGNAVSFGTTNLISVGTVNATTWQPSTGTTITIPASYVLDVNAINPATGNSVSFGSSNLISVGTLNATVLQPPTGTTISIPSAYTLLTNTINPVNGASLSFGSGTTTSAGTVQASNAVSTNVLQPLSLTTVTVPSGNTLALNALTTALGNTITVASGKSISVDQLEGTTNTNVAIASNLTVNSPYWLNTNNISAASGGIITVAAGQILRVDTLEATTAGRNITIIGNFSFGTSEVFFNKVSAVSGNSITVNAGEIWKTDYIAGTTANNVTFLSNLTVAAGFWIYANELAAQTGNVLTVSTTTYLAVNNLQPATGNSVSFGASNIVSVGTVNATTWQPPTGTVVTVPAAYTLQVNTVNPVTGNSVSFGSGNLISVGTVNTTVLQPPTGTTISIPSAYTLLTNTINPVNGASLSFGSGTTTSAGTVQASTAVSTNILQPLSLSTVTVPSGNTLAVNALTTALGGTIAVASGKSISVDQLEGTTTTNVNFASNLTVSSPFWLNANNLSAAAGGIITVAAGQVLRVDTLEATTPGRNITIIGNFSFGSSEVFFNKVSAASGNSIAVNAGEIWKTDFVAGTAANNVTVLSNLTVAAGFWIYANELAAQTGSVFTIAPSTTLAVNNVQPATGNSVSFGSANLISVGTLNATTWQPPTGTTVTIPSAYTLLTNTINPASGNSVSFGGSNLISAGTVNATTWQPATGTVVTIPAAYTLQTNAINPVSGNAVSFGASNLISAGTVNATTWQPVTGTVVTIPAAYTLQTNAINPTTGNSVAFGSGNLISVGTVNATTWQPATGTVVTIPAAYTLQTNAINPTSGNSVTFGSGNLISVGTLNTTVIQPPTGTVITIPSAYTLEVNNIAPAFGSTVTINGIVAFTELETNTITPATGTTLTLAGVDLLQGNNTNVLLGPGGLSNLSLCIPALTTTVGTINQTGTSVTGVGTAFQTLNMVGGCLLASTGQACFVTAVTSTTLLTCSNSQTIPSGTKFQLGYGGNNMDGLGNIGTKVLYTGKIQPSPASATITIVGPTLFSSGAAQFPLGVQTSSIVPYSGTTVTITAGADILTNTVGAVRCTTTNALSPGQVTQSGYTITYVSGTSFSPTWVGGCFAPVVSGSYGCIITAVTSTTSMTCSVSQTISSATNYVLGVNGTAMDTTGLFSGKAIYAYGNSALTLVPGSGSSVVVSSANGGIGLSVNQIQPASGSVIAVATGNSLSVDQLEGTTTTNISVASNLTVNSPYWLNANNLSASTGGIITVAAGQVLRVDTLEATTPGRNITIIGNFSFGSNEVFFNKVSAVSGNVITVNAGEIWKTDYLAGTSSNNITVLSNLTVASGYSIFANALAAQTGSVFAISSATTLGVNSIQPTSGKSVTISGNQLVLPAPLGTGSAVCVTPTLASLGSTTISQYGSQTVVANGTPFSISIVGACLVPALGTGCIITAYINASAVTCSTPQSYVGSTFSYGFGGALDAAGTVTAMTILPYGSTNITLIPGYGSYVAVSTANGGLGLKTSYIAPYSGTVVTISSASALAVNSIQASSGTTVAFAAADTVTLNTLNATSGGVISIPAPTVLSLGTLQASVGVSTNSIQPISASSVTITGNQVVVPPVAFTGSAMCVPRSMTAQSGTITQNGYAITASGSSFSATIVGACLVPALGSGCIVTGYTSPTAVTCSVYQSYTASAFSYDTSFVVGSGMDSSGTVSASNIYSSGTLTLIPNSGNYVSISTANGGNGLKTNLIAPFSGSTLTLSATSITTSNNAALTLPATSSVSAYYGDFSVLQPQSGTGAIAINSPNYLQAYQVQTNTLNPQSGNTVTIGQSNVLFVGTVETNTLTAITSGGPVTVNASSITYAAAGTGTINCVPNSIVTTGTVSQSGYVVTGTGFTSALVGACLIPVNGAGCMIVAYTSATSVNCSVFQTYTASAYSLGKSGTAMDSNGNLAANAIYADGTNSLTIVPGNGGNLAISTANGGSGLSTNTIQAFSGTTVAFAAADTVTLNTLNATSGGVIAVVGTTTFTTNILNATSGGIITIPSSTTLSVGTIAATTIKSNTWQAASGSVVTIASADTLAVNSIQSTTGTTISFSATDTVTVNTLNATSGGIITIDGGTILAVDVFQPSASNVVTFLSEILVPDGILANLIYTYPQQFSSQSFFLNALQINGTVLVGAQSQAYSSAVCIPAHLYEPTYATISQTGYTIKGTGTAFTSSLIGGCLLASGGQTCFVTAVTNATSLTCSVSQTITGNTYFEVGYSGSNLDNAGNVGANAIYASGSNNLTLVAGSGGYVTLPTTNGGLGLKTNNIAPYSGSVITITSGSLSAPSISTSSISVNTINPQSGSVVTITSGSLSAPSISTSSISVNTINPQSGYVVTMTGNLLNGPSSHIAGNANGGGGGMSVPFFSQTNGLITQNGTYVTITGATFNSGMVCGLFVPSGSGASPSRITAYINSTVITVHMANTISTPSTYEISYGGAGIYGDDTVCTQQIFSQVNGITLNPNSGNGVYVATGTGLFTNVIGSYSGSTISVSSNNVLAVNSIAPYGGSTVISVASSAIKIASTVPVQLNTVQPSSGLTITHAANDLVYNSGGSAVMVCLPRNLIAVANTITIAQTGTFTVTATGGAPFNSSMIGGCLLPASASSCVITAFLTTSTVNCSIAQTYSGLTFSVGDLGTAMDSAGALGAKTIYADDSTPLTLVSGPGNPVIISTANGGTGLQVNNISPATGSTTTIGGMTLVTPSAMYVGNNNGGGGGLGLCFSEYSTGTVTLSGNDVYGIGTTFVVGMVGGLFNPTTGVQASRIAYFLNATHIQVAYPWNYSPITTAYSICWGAAGMFSDASMTAQSHYSQDSITMYPYTGSTFTVSNAQGGLGQTWTNNINSYSPTPYNYYEEINTYSMTWIGPYSGSQGAQAGNIAIVRSGSVVTLKFAIPPIVTTGGYTSRIASYSLLAARHSPTATLSFIIPVQANGTQVDGYMEVHSNGQIYIYSTPVFGNFLVGSLTGVPGCAVNYIVGF
jgi:ribosomal protein L21